MKLWDEKQLSPCLRQIHGTGWDPLDSRQLASPRGRQQRGVGGDPAKWAEKEQPEAGREPGAPGAPALSPGLGGEPQLRAEATGEPIPEPALPAAGPPLLPCLLAAAGLQ